MPAAQSQPARTCLLPVRVAGELGCGHETPLTRGRTCARAGEQAPTQPRWPACLTWTLDICLQGLSVGGMAFTKGWYGASLEELPSPFPGLGLSLLEAAHGAKAHQAIPWEADFFLLSSGTDPFTQAGRVQLPAKGCSMRHRSKHSAPPPAGVTDLPGAHLGVADEPKGTLGCALCSMPVTDLPTIPSSGTCLQHRRPPPALLTSDGDGVSAGELRYVGSQDRIGWKNFDGQVPAESVYFHLLHPSPGDGLRLAPTNQASPCRLPRGHKLKVQPPLQGHCGQEGGQQPTPQGTGTAAVSVLAVLARGHANRPTHAAHLPPIGHNPAEQGQHWGHRSPPADISRRVSLPW